MPEEYQVFYPSVTAEKEIVASVVIENGTSREDQIRIRQAIREAAVLSLEASGVQAGVPGARTVAIESPRQIDERLVD